MNNSKKLSRRNFAKKSALIAAAGAVAPQLLNSKSTEETLNTDYDYIVVGSGAGGGPLAANLARHGFKVLVLEAGAKDPKTDNYKIPAYHPLASEDEKLSWNYFVKHYSGDRDQLDSKYVPGKGILYPRGATIGGSTAVNAMITVYPHANDFEYIAELTGDDSWRAENMREYFKRLENCEYLKTNEAIREDHGLDGWLPTNYQNQDIGTLLENTSLLGIIKANLDYTGRNILEMFFNEKSFDVNKRSFERGGEGALLIPQTMDKKASRHSVREYLLETQELYPENLTIITDALVSKVVFNEQKEAIGVEYIKGNNLYEADRLYDDTSNPDAPLFVKATREVILSAGAFNTPQILQLSGVGEASLLEEKGIHVIQDLPGVGRNLQDRYEVGVSYKLKEKILETCTFSEGNDVCLNKYNNSAVGPYTSSGVAAANIKRSDPQLPDPDLFTFCVTTDFIGYYPGYSETIKTTRDKITWALLKGHTENTAGEVKIKSGDPRKTPNINFKNFTDAQDLDGSDMKALIKGVDNIRTIMKSRHVRNIIEKETWPGSEVESYEDMRDFIARETWGHHACGTCKIGNGDTNDVLDSNFKVQGVKNLRVVDASVFPKIPGFFIAVPIYLISEKATDVILNDAGVERNQNLLRRKINQFTKSRAEQKLDAISVKAYPNPCIDEVHFTVDKNHATTNGYLIIVDNTGKIVFNQSYSGFEKITVDTSQLPSGVYTYLLQLGNIKKTERFIKQ
ncbi:GMC oxidoreductase [Aquimarina sp. 2304DJ70-9]|uniref:GMC oxidoreductase n=1 Tax=Aquimarina penaris TaxID=3231044 RepID=UPI0034619DE6